MSRTWYVTHVCSRISCDAVTLDKKQWTSRMQPYYSKLLFQNFFIQHRRIWDLRYLGQIIALTSFILILFWALANWTCWCLCSTFRHFSEEFSSGKVVSQLNSRQLGSWWRLSWPTYGKRQALSRHFSATFDIWHKFQSEPLAHFISPRHLIKNFLQLKKRQFDRCYDLQLLVRLIWSRLASKWHFTTCISYLDLVYKCRAEEWGYTRSGGF